MSAYGDYVESLENMLLTIDEKLGTDVEQRLTDEEYEDFCSLVMSIQNDRTENYN
jgi:hypothetical protein